ncbi:25637_t:CDS:2, partial [Dentiscutata erythropus]
ISSTNVMNSEISSNKNLSDSTCQRNHSCRHAYSETVADMIMTEEDDQEYVIAYASHILTPVKQNYSTVKLECFT